MASGSDTSSIGTWSLPAVVMALLVGIGFVSTKRDPVKSARPQEELWPVTVTDRLQDVPARLWQDPIAAVERAAGGRGARTSSGENPGTEPPSAVATRTSGSHVNHPDDASGQQDASPFVGGVIGSWDPSRWLAEARALFFKPESAPRKAEGGNRALDAVVKEVAAAADVGPEKHLLVLATYVSGEVSGVQVESRRRTRYAVISALGATGFVPHSSEYIGYFSHQVAASKNCGSEHRTELPPSTTIRVPFELFHRGTDSAGIGMPSACSTTSVPACGVPGDYAHVLVLWLDAEAFRTHPLCKTQEMFGRIRACFPDRASVGTCTQPAETEGLVHSAIIGPADSDGLIEMLEEYERLRRMRCGTAREILRHGTAVYSPWATISDGSLLPLLEARLGTAGKGRLSFETTGDIRFACRDFTFRLDRTIGTDEALADLLVRELHLRRACPSDPGNHVAIFSEWDKAYGRAWPRTFERAIEKERGERDHAECREPSPEPPRSQDGSLANLHLFRYLQGIDETSGEQPLSVTTQRKPESTQQEWPQGQGQLDYVHRQAARLEQLKEEIERSGSGRLSAIGILGNDVYDKLLLLQTLRHRFPDVVFFTTDLDASLASRRAYDWTRNLVIASHFGLQLHPDLQNGIPPFRDSYRTSVYYACIRAIRPDRDFPEREAGRIYEVGRHGAYDLSAAGDCGIHAPGPRGQFWLTDRDRWFYGSVALCCGLLLIVPLRHSMQDRVAVILSREAGARRTRVCYALTIVTAAMLLVGLVRLIQADHRSGTGEPFALFEGISVWPTTLLRMLAGVLTVCFLADAYSKFNCNYACLSDRYGVPSATRLGARCAAKRDGRTGPWMLMRRMGFRTLPGLLRSVVTRVWSAYRRAWLMEWRVAGRAVGASELWTGYMERAQWRSRAIRIFVMGVVYFVACKMFFELWGFPFNPSRGELCYRVEQVALYCSVFALIILMIFVLDATLLTDRLLYLVSTRRIRWDDGVLKRHAPLGELDRDVLSEKLKIQFLGDHTSVVTGLIYCPFVVLLVMMLARHQHFDAWDHPFSLLAVFSLSGAGAVLAAWYLGRQAKRIRGGTLQYLNERLVAERARNATGQDRQRPRSLAIVSNRVARIRGSAGEPATDRGAVIEQIRDAIEYVRQYRKGAFCPTREYPVIRAVLIPFGGVGTLALVEWVLPILRPFGSGW